MAPVRVALLACLLTLVGVLESRAQTWYDVTGGPGSTQAWYQYDYVNPYHDYWWTGRSQYLIRASELQAAGVPGGQIVALGVQVGAYYAGIAPPPRRYRIWIKHTTATQITQLDNDRSTFTLVYDVDNFVPQQNAWNIHTFSVPFTWDGSSNLLIEICNYRTGWTYNFPQYWGTTVNPVYYYPHAYFVSDGADYCVNLFTGYAGYTWRPVFRFGVLTGIIASFPDDVDPRRILRAGEIYAGQDAQHPKPSLTYRASGNIALTYKIVGPLPSQDPVYIATEGGNPNDTIINLSYSASGTYTYTMGSAKGPYAGTGGALDLTNAVGGSYRLIASYSMPGYTQEWIKDFIVAFPNDLALVEILDPQSNAPPRRAKYPMGVSIPVAAQFQNVGLNPITAFRAIAQIRRASDNQLVYADTVDWTGTLPSTEKVSITFRRFTQTTQPGIYKVQMCGILLNATDNQPANNCAPQVGDYTFEIAYDFEVEATAVVYPSSAATLYAGRPFSPVGAFTNNGIGDVTNVQVRMVITRLSPPPQVDVYVADTTIPDIPLNTTMSIGFRFFVPQQQGTYRACIYVTDPRDQLAANNSTCTEFTVQGPLSGTYTVGTLFAGSPRNFNTIQDAVNALYERGVGGPVVFELTDAYYEVGDLNSGLPAIELSGKIVGVNAQNTVTWRAYGQRALQRGSVTIRLKSGGGIGILMAQSSTPANPNAVYYVTRDPKDANFSGYIIFDGGAQKSLKFELEAPVSQPRRAVFYLGRGVHHVQVRNCLIGNAPTSSASYASSLPRVRLNVALGQFEWEPDVRIVGGQPVTYSAGVVIRNWRLSAYQGVDVLDTVTCSYNVVEGNEISGFGYGIVSLGLGPLKEAGPAKVRRYYNVENVIRGNLITNVRAAGIVVGYEEGVQIVGNRIDNVGKGATGGSEPASGIVAGGFGAYNVIGAVIEGNEISRVESDVLARGIVVEQVQNYLTGLEPQPVVMPDVPEQTRVVNNIVWDVRRGSAGAHVGGIHLWTERDPAQTGLMALLVPRRWGYWTRGDVVAHNTVWIGDDGVAGNGLVGGIVVQQAWAPEVVNNAVAVGTAQAMTRAAVMYEGLHPRRSGGIQQNWNAYWVAAGGDVVRMVEVLESGGQYALQMGYDGEYGTLSSWRAATGQDWESVWGDWTGDYVASGTVVARLRVRTSPAPLGSILSNRGKAGVWSRDIDGEVRGAGGSRPDIGADEFVGREYQQDVEVVEIVEPLAWRAGSGPYADAEYVMQRGAARVRARIANRGISDVVDWRVRVQVLREDGAGQFTVPVWTREVRVDVRAGQELEVDFGSGWTPEPYAGLSGYVVPAPFVGMEPWVTPRYRVVVTTQPDQNGANNTRAKEVRYYVGRAPVMVTVDRGSVVGQRNADTLLAGVSRLGWRVDAGQGRYDYDLLNRAGWEPRAVSYEGYRWVFWSGREGAVSRWEREALRGYIGGGQFGQKRNVVMSSQEVARAHVGLDPVNDEWFVRRVLRAQYVAPGTPVGSGYDGLYVLGRTVGLGMREQLRASAPGDVPMPALLRVYSDAETDGLAQAAYVYETRDAGVVDSVAGVGTAALGWNMAYYGIEWRHWGRVEQMLRATVDFLRRNGGGVVGLEPAPEEREPVKGSWVRVSPTVAQEELWVEYGGGGGQVEVYDGIGQRVWSGELVGSGGVVRIGTGQWASGVYVVVVRQGERVQVEQVRVVR
jgi:hypothetical protein